MMRLLVRCCCKPQKILGSLPYDGSNKLQIPKLDETGRFGNITLAVETFSDTMKVSDALLAESMRDPLVAANVREMFYRERAYKSEDISIEVLRRIPGFVEAPELTRFDYVCPYCFGDLRSCPCPNKEKNS